MHNWWSVHNNVYCIEHVLHTQAAHANRSNKKQHWTAQQRRNFFLCNSLSSINLIDYNAFEIETKTKAETETETETQTKQFPKYRLHIWRHSFSTSVSCETLNVVAQLGTIITISVSVDCLCPSKTLQTEIIHWACSLYRFIYDSDWIFNVKLVKEVAKQMAPIQFNEFTFFSSRRSWQPH